MHKHFKIIGLAIYHVEKTRQQIVISPNNPYETFLHCFSERFLHNFRILRHELRHRQKNKYLDQSLAKNLRSSLLDFLIVRYLSIRSIEDTNNPNGLANFRNNINKLLCDHLKNGMEYLTQLKTRNWIGNDEYAQRLNGLRLNYPTCFLEGEINLENPENSLITSEYLSPKGMFKSVPKKEEYNDFAVAYEIYLHFSRYDHFGTFSPTLTNQKITDKHLVPTILFMLRGSILSLQLVQGAPNNPSYRHLIQLEDKMKQFKYTQS